MSNNDLQGMHTYVKEKEWREYLFIVLFEKGTGFFLSKSFQGKLSVSEHSVNVGVVFDG